MNKKGEYMIRTFKQTSNFSKKWDSLGLGNDELIILENILLKNPEFGNVIQGTGGIRKLRIPLNDKGKSSGGRVIYVDIEVKETIYLLDVYAKNEKINLTSKETKLLKNLVEILKEE